MLLGMLKDVYRRYVVIPGIHRTYKDLSVQETFQAIYRTKTWGDAGTPFCSGVGSRGLVSQNYCNLVVKFIQENGIRRVIDLGCGDFVVGKRIVDETDVEYIGVDVVPELIEYHNQTSQNSRIHFQCADITKDPLPDADLCLVRQVLQHLSNGEAGDALANCRRFRRVLVSEDVPTRPKSFNRDKTHGPDIRGHYGSGVYLDQPPFSLPIASEWNFELSEKSLLRVVLLENSDGVKA
jgi:SAM-dependent methyltransferase